MGHPDRSAHRVPLHCILALPHRQQQCHLRAVDLQERLERLRDLWLLRLQPELLPDHLLPPLLHLLLDLLSADQIWVLGLARALIPHERGHIDEAELEHGLLQPSLPVGAQNCP